MRNELRELVERHSLAAKFWCFLSHELNTELRLSPDTLQRIADLGACLGLDIYVHVEEPSSMQP